jgi:uncharacterized membrane protein
VVDSFWVVPSIFLIGAVALAYLLGVLDRAVTTSVWWVGTPDAAGNVLAAIATAMLTFLGVVFSITLVALQLASQQFSPRVTRTFVRSTTTKVAFGVFTATFVTALLSLSRVESGASDLPGPVASVTVSLLLVGASLVVFIAFVNAITTLIRVAHLIAAVAEETRAALADHFVPAHAYIEATVPSLDGPVTVVTTGPSTMRTRRHTRGVLLGIDRARLVELGEAYDCVIKFVVRVGQYLGPGAPLAEVYGVRGPTPGEVLRAVQFGRERTLYQDPAYGIRELVDIGSQALSPAVNAPTTAVQVIDRVTELLTRIGTQPDRTGRYADYDGVVRLVLSEAGWTEMVDLAFTELRTFGMRSPQVTRRLIAAFDRLEAVLPDERHEPLHAHRATLIDEAQAYWPDDRQRSQALTSDPLGLG